MRYSRSAAAGSARSAPQALQKLEPSGFSRPQAGQVSTSEAYDGSGAANRSSRQSLQRMGLPGGYSKSKAPSSSKSSLRQIAFEGALSTEGKAWNQRCLPSARGGVDRQPGRLAGDPAALELGQHRPAGLPDGRVAPVLLPVADRADCARRSSSSTILNMRPWFGSRRS